VREELALPLLAFRDLCIGGLIIGGLIGELPSGRGASCAHPKFTQAIKLSNSALEIRAARRRNLLTSNII
jgi:hypothetical protein